jgi:hypothetical protein
MKMTMKQAGVYIFSAAGNGAVGSQAMGSGNQQVIE